MGVPAVLGAFQPHGRGCPAAEGQLQRAGNEGERLDGYWVQWELADSEEAVFQSWYNGECPPTLLNMEDRKKNCEEEDKCSAAEIPLFTDMTAHAREYLRVHSEPPEEAAPAWHMGKHFRVGANKAVPPEYERLRAMGEEEFKRDLRRTLKAVPASEAYGRV